MKHELTGAGKGDKPRISNYDKYTKAWEKIYGKKGWRYWVVWDGLDLEEVMFDDSNLTNDEQISYSEYKKRLKYQQQYE